MEDLCGIFGGPMKDRGYKAYGCELCAAWLHAKCVFPNASEAKLKILFEFNYSFDVKCQECKQKQKVKLTNLVTKEDFNNFTSVIEQKIKSGPNFIKECGKETFANIATTIQNNLADAPFFQQFSKKQEEEDKNKHKNNLILFGLPECTSDSSTTCIKDDYSKVKHLYEDHLNLSSNDIINVVRLGLKSDNSNKTRPLLIKCTNENKKWEFLRASKNLKFCQDHKSVQIWATPDHTTKEKDERKKLIKTLKERKQNGETNLTICNNKIVIKASENSMDEPFHGTAQSFWPNLFD